MKTSDFTDKKVTELSRSHSDDFSELSYSRGREAEDFDDFSFGLSKDDSDHGFRFRHVRPVALPDSYGSDFQNHAAMDFDHMRNVGTSNDGGLISVIDQKMEEYSKNLLHAVEGLNARLCQLETRTRKIENSVDELKDSSVFNHGRTEKKLRELENVLTKLQAGIRDLRDKQEISEAQIEVAKVQILKDHQKSEEKTRVNTSSGQVQSSVQQQSNQSQPAYNVLPLQQFPSQSPVASTPSHQSFPPPIPSSSGQFLAQSLLQSQLSSVSPPVLSSESTNQYYSPIPPTSSLPYQPCQSVQQLPPTSHIPQPPLQPSTHGVIDLRPRHSSPISQLPLTLQSQQLPLQSYNADDPQTQTFQSHNFGGIPYMQSQTYNTSIHSTFNAPSLAPPNRQVHFGSSPRGSEFRPVHIQQSRQTSFHDDYTRFGVHSDYNVPMPRPTSSERQPLSSVLGSESRFSQTPNLQALPRALPMASEVSSGSDSGGSGNGTSIEDVMDKVVAMGFRRDLVRATVKKMTENGQSVDLNVVLDKLMNS